MGGNKAREREAMTAQDLARRWKVTARHVRDLANEGELPSFRVGTALRFWEHDVERFERLAAA
ncbi:helix-turn-helix domain-containing protein [Tsukamurella ocularis]|uniref:helix-turn-helix domain-containing protein n=1 Tax=Tsukamurella ocularis TaxID=1970234 RepID=UPI0039EDF87A